MGLFSSIGGLIGGAFGAPQIGALVGGAGDMALGSSGAGKAGKGMNAYLQAALDALKAGGAETEKRLKPTADIGSNSIGMLSDILIDGDMSKFYDNPAYKYALDQSMRGIQANAAAKGSLMSGNTLKELQKNASGLASQNYNSFITNLGNLFNQADPYLSSYSNLPYQRGQDAANILIGQGANARDTAMNKSNIWSSAGNFGGFGGASGGIGELLGGLGGLFGGGSSGGFSGDDLGMLLGDWG